MAHSVGERHQRVGHLPAHDPLGSSLVHALLNVVLISSRQHILLDGGAEHQSASPGQRLHGELHYRPARLRHHVRPFADPGSGGSLPVYDPGLGHHCLEPVALLEQILHHFPLYHSGDPDAHLPGRGVVVQRQQRLLLRQFLQGRQQRRSVLLLLRRDSHQQHGLRYGSLPALRSSSYHIAVAEIGKSADRSDLPCPEGLYVLMSGTGVSSELSDLVLVPVLTVHCVADCHLPAEEPYETDLSYDRVMYDAEHFPGEFRLFVLRRSRQKLCYGVQQIFYALSLFGAGADDGNRHSFCAGFRKRCPPLIIDYLLLREQLLFYVTVKAGKIQEHVFPAGRTESGYFALRLAFPGHAVYQNGLSSCQFAESCQHGAHIASGAVHLVDDRYDRDTVLLRSSPQDFGVRLDPIHRRDHQDGPVQYGQRPLHLSGEVHVSRSVYDADTVVSVSHLSAC